MGKHRAGLAAGVVAALVAAAPAGAADPTASAYRDAVVADAPHAYWRLGDGDGAAQARDEMGRLPSLPQSRGGPTFGVPGALAGDPDTAAAFDGLTTHTDGQFLHVWSNDLGFGHRTPFTLEAWVRPRSLNTHTRRIFSKEPWGLAAGVLLGARADGLVFSRDAGGRATTVRAPLRADRWSHVAATYDGTTMRLYVDGAQAAAAPSTQELPSGGPLVIGSLHGTWKFFAGAIDEPAVYTHAVPAARLAAHHRAGAGG